MKILEQHPDGSKTIQYESGDRIVFVKDANEGGFLGAKKGERGTVIRGAGIEEKHPSIAFLYVQTDQSKADGYGTIHVAPWDVELYVPCCQGWGRHDITCALYGKVKS